MAFKAAKQFPTVTLDSVSACPAVEQADNCTHHIPNHIHLLEAHQYVLEPVPLLDM